MENNNNKQPRYFYEGQTVYHSSYGRGVVFSIEDHRDEPISVSFKVSNQKEFRNFFTLDGRLRRDLPVSLSQNPIPEIKNVPLPEMPDLKAGDAVLCWDDDQKTARVGSFVEFIHGDPLPYKMRFYPMNNDPSGIYTGFKNAEKYDPEKHYKP